MHATISIRRYQTPVLLGTLIVLAFTITDAEEQLVLSKSTSDKCLDVLRAGLRGDEFWPSIHAAEGLNLAGHGDEVRKYLAPKLVTEVDDQRRCGLARELVRAGEWRKSAIMLDILAGEISHGHTHAAESLYKVIEIGDGRAMRRAMAQSKSPKLQLMAAAALGRCANPTAMKLLRDKLADPDTEISRTAAWILARIGSEIDIPQLRKNTEASKDPLTKSYNEHALAALGDEAGLRALRENLASVDPRIRTYAATFAGEIRDFALSGKLEELLQDENIDVRVRAAQSLLMFTRPSAPKSIRDNSQLVYPATNEHPRYTEGSIVRLSDDSLLFAVTQFVGGGSDFSHAQIIARRSIDIGNTWSAPRVLQESTGKMNVMSVSLRRLNESNGDTLAMFYLQKNSYDDLQAYVCFSQDDAKTFGEPVRITTEPGYHVMNNDRVVQLSSGRLLAPIASTPDVHKINHFVSSCWLSDDGGKTWRKGKGQVDQAKRGAMEPEVIELDDGRVMMIVRTQLGYIAMSYSRDGGDTWSEAKQLANLRAPEAPATLRRIPATGDLLLIWNNKYIPGAGHGGKRTPLTAAVSSDEGNSWKHVRNLESDIERSYAYTSLTFVKDRAIMSYWESDADRLSSRFRSLPIDWFYSAECTE